MTPHGDVRQRLWSSARWMLPAILLVVVAALALRLGTRVLHQPLIFDEPYITVPIIDLIEKGWSKQTAIDFRETKGPGLIWLYAIAGEALGSSLNGLRLVSVICFMLGAVPLIDLARRCGMGGWSLCVVAALYVLLPYHAPLGQMVMSEPSFVLFSLIACWLFVWGVGACSEDDRGSSQASANRARRILAPGLFTIVLSILLHNRVHAAALAPAVCLVALERGGMRLAWPWAIACLIAGLSRIPLLLYWGGIVSPAFQGLHSLGVRVDGLTYFLAALAPSLVLFIPQALRSDGRGPRRALIAVGAGTGLLLAVLAMPRLNEIVDSAGIQQARYSGVVASAAKMLTAQPIGQSIVLGVMAVLGGAGLGALSMMVWRCEASSALGAVNRIQFWTLFCGCAMYLASAAPVYDRYVLAWTMLLPIVWARELPRPALILQMVGLAGIAVWLTARWLI
jgi:hypothetical protein